jgi:cytochrome c556
MIQLFESLAACLLIAVVALPFPALADDQDTIDYRQHIMNTLDEQSAAIDQILQHKAPPDNIAIHTQIVAITAAMAKKSFAPKVLGGESKPAVWSNWADFSKRLDGLVAYTQGVAQAAKQGGVAAAGPALAAAHPCQDCHEIYRVQKK